ncbi:MAG: nuclear transport factor 2 family protein [Pseudomonadota bacterium]
MTEPKRAEPPSRGTQRDAQREVLAANRAFYAAFRSADYDRMLSLWSERDAVSVLHPGCGEISGRDAVMASWFRILASGNAPDIYAEDETVIVTGGRAFVICVERIGPSTIAATNLFVREGRTWRLTHHQATSFPSLH